MAADATGRLIRIGDVCGYANRRGKESRQDIVIIKEISPLRGNKIVFDEDRNENILVATKPIKVSTYLIITDLTEKEVLSLMRVKSNRSTPRKYKPRKSQDSAGETSTVIQMDEGQQMV